MHVDKLLQMTVADVAVHGEVDDRLNEQLAAHRQTVRRRRRRWTTTMARRARPLSCRARAGASTRGCRSTSISSTGPVFRFFAAAALVVVFLSRWRNDDECSATHARPSRSSARSTQTSSRRRCGALRVCFAVSVASVARADERARRRRRRRLAVERVGRRAHQRRHAVVVRARRQYVAGQRHARQQSALPLAPLPNLVNSKTHHPPSPRSLRLPCEAQPATPDRDALRANRRATRNTVAPRRAAPL